MDVEAPTSLQAARERIGRSVRAPRITLPFSERRTLLLIGDAIVVNAAVLIALFLWAMLEDQALTVAFVRQRWLWFPLLTGVWWFLGWLGDLYDVPTAARRTRVTQRIIASFFGMTVGYLLVYFLLPRDALPRLFFLFFVGIALPGTLAWRWAYATVLALPLLRERVLIVGAGWAGRAIAEVLTKQETATYHVCGFIDDDPAKQESTVANLPVLGASDKLVSLVQAYKVNKIVVSVTHGMRGEAFQALMDCRAMGTRIVRMPELYEQLTRRVPVEHVSEGWVLNALNGFSSLSRVEQAARRLLDIFCSLVGLLGLGFVLPFVALAIYLDDRGPVFYKQARAGLGGNPFCVVKLRTMRSDAEADGRARWAQENDERVTRVGRFFRKTRLDELPQVINVLRGEMSFVGPRPERPEFIAELEKQIPFYRTRLVVKPGITGWAQIHYGYGNSVNDALIKLQYDLHYIRHRSIWLDFYVIFKTVGVTLRGSGT